MGKVFSSTVDAGLRILNLDPVAVKQAMEKNRQLRGLVHVSA
jgi:hypothetical protein